MRVEYSYLEKQFDDVDLIFRDLKNWVKTGQFTLGPAVENFEKKFGRYIGAKHVIGTNTGTDALILALKALKVGPGDEVITVPNTFTATVGAIAAAGARPVFVDVDGRYLMDVRLIEKVITPRTRVILPVHWGGCPADMKAILQIANHHDIAVLEDACPAVGAEIQGQKAGTFGSLGAFSMHPLKPLNVLGDGGMIATQSDELASFLRLYRNHGLIDRDHIAFWGMNARLQPFQAIVANRLLDSLEDQNETRIQMARRLDQALEDMSEFVRIAPRPEGFREVYQLYVIRVARREEFMRFMESKGIEVKIHYPIPLHLQHAARDLGYRKGDFPVSEKQAEEIVTLPLHPFMTMEQVDYMADTIHHFFQHSTVAL